MSLVTLSLATTVVVALFLARGASARFTPMNTLTYVEIEGQNYGVFNQINDLRDISKTNKDESYTRVVLRRDFVTDASLYLWARKNAEGRAPLKDIRLLTKTEDGHEVSRYVLRLCKPLSWTVEEAEHALGGFHEKIEVAVQEIAVY